MHGLWSVRHAHVSAAGWPSSLNQPTSAMPTAEAQGHTTEWGISKVHKRGADVQVGQLPISGSASSSRPPNNPGSGSSPASTVLRDAGLPAMRAHRVCSFYLRLPIARGDTNHLREDRAMLDCCLLAPVCRGCSETCFMMWRRCCRCAGSNRPANGSGATSVGRQCQWQWWWFCLCPSSPAP
jgi:hypothetical protein